MVHLELQPDVEAQLAQEARSRGLSVERYIQTIMESRPVAAAHDSSMVSGAVERIRELSRANRLGGLRIKELIEEGRKY